MKMITTNRHIETYSYSKFVHIMPYHIPFSQMFGLVQYFWTIVREGHYLSEYCYTKNLVSFLVKHCIFPVSICLSV